MKNSRRQVTLFLSGHPAVEALRQQFNPAQAGLIGAHVTLCREDEVDDWHEMSRNLSTIESPVELAFGRPVRDGDLVYLPAAGSTEDFDRLRFHLLGPDGRRHSPHITIIHPRNATCTDSIFGEIEGRSIPFSHTFVEAAIIEQTNGAAWIVLERFRFDPITR
ncbi:MAG: 2'-5' RNA ligase family protein [Acidobacteriota bacterium]